MRSTVVVITVALAAGCAHGQDRAQTTTITSGNAPSGVRVTDVREVDERPDLRLADELCRREDTCDRIGRAGEYPTIESCMADLGVRARTQVSGWNCEPAAARARIEECLASVRSEPCSTILQRADQLPMCRANVTCGP